MSTARGSRIASAAVVVLAVFALLVTVLTRGALLGSFGLLAPLLDPGGPDYANSRLPGFTPLSRGYIADVLGGAAPVPGSPPRAARTAFGSRVLPGVRTPQLETIEPLTNDHIRDARAVGRIPYRATTNTAGASREPGDPATCGPLGGGTVWFRYTAPSDIGLFANTFGSAQATTLGVYRGRPGSLVNIGCDTDQAGNALWEFPAERGHTYYFQLAGPLGGGRSVFSLEPLGTTRLLSGAAGSAGNGSSLYPSISADGRIVAFESEATNLATRQLDGECLGEDPASYGPNSYNRIYDEMYPGCWRILVADRKTGRIVLASVSSGGEPANSDAVYPVLSGNGRYVAFSSTATNLVPGDTNGIPDVFVHDLVTRRTERVSVDSAGRQAIDDPLLSASELPSISHDGRWVAFESASANLVEGDTNLAPDVFVHDRLTRKTIRVSVDPAGEQAEIAGPALDNYQRATRFSTTSAFAKISPDGRWIAFRSAASNLVPGDTNGVADTFLHDLRSGRTVRVSVDSAEREADGGTVPGVNSICISGDGRFVGFSSPASNLVPGDRNGTPDVFVRDTIAGTTERVTVSSDGVEQRPPALLVPATFTSALPCSLSADGRHVGFASLASNLVPGDTNERLDAFVHDLLTRATRRISVNSNGEPLSDDSSNPVLAADGRTIVFDSYASFNGISQAYVHERPPIE